MAIHTNIENIKVKFIIENNGKEYIQEVKQFYNDLSLIVSGQVYIRECSKVLINLDTANKLCNLEVKNIIEESDDYIKIYPGETKKLFEDKSDYSMLIPGDYVYRIILENQVYYNIFTILPRHINDIQLQNLRKFVNEQIGGLSYNITTSGITSQASREKSLPDYINLFNCYKKQFKDISQTINKIIADPITSIEKNYEKRQNTRINDSKTIRFKQKLNSRDCLQVRRYPSVLNKENIFIKNLILIMYNDLRAIESKLIECIEQLNFELQFRRKEFSQKESRIDSSRSSDFKIQESQRRVKSLNQSLLNLNETYNKIENINEYINQTRRMLIILSRSLHSDLFEGIVESNTKYPTKLIFKDSRYHKLYRSYKYIVEARKKEILNYKPSDILYEYFILLLTIRVINEFGFELIDCDFKDVVSSSFIDKIPEGLCAVFMKNDIKIEVWYEKELLSTSTQVIDEGGDFYTHTNNKLPDIRIDIYSGKKLLKSVIVEVKYRRYAYLWNEYFNTDTMIQIKNYKTTIQYYSPYINRSIFPVNKVIVVYPGQHDVSIVEEKEWGDFLFIQVRPADEENSIYGYEQFKNVLEQVLKDTSI